MGDQGNRNVSQTHSLFVADLKIHQEPHNLSKEVNEIIVQASLDTDVCYGEKKLCSNVEMMRGMKLSDGLQVSLERMRTFDPD